MAKTPLRALRVSDDLWRSAQVCALRRGENLSVVVRRALLEYVESPVDTPGEELAPAVGAPPADAPQAARALEREQLLLVAQGMVMQRFGQGAEKSLAYLTRVAEAAEVDIEVAARRVVESEGDVARWAAVPSAVEQL